MAQRTFSIIKPDAVSKGYTGAILAEIEKAGFKMISIQASSRFQRSKPRGSITYTRHGRSSMTCAHLCRQVRFS